MMRNWKTSSMQCREQLLILVRLLRQLRIFPSVFWVPSKDNIADAPSRLRERHLYTMPAWLANHVRVKFRP